MKRTVYEAPITECFHVEMEGAFCSGSADVDNPNTETGQIEEHKTNTDFSADFGGTGWD
jgi:hypothetical protein